MKEYLVVDGYNLIFNAPELESLELDHARERLIDILADVAGLTGWFVILVFDAHKVAGGIGRTEHIGPVEVIYTAEGETADNAIERLVQRLAGEATVHVVTGDWTEQRMIFGQGAYRMPPREFWLRVRDLRRKHGDYRKDRPADAYLENRLRPDTLKVLEAWRRKKLCE